MHHTFKTHTDSLDNTYTYVLINLNIYTPKWTHPNEHTQMNTPKWTHIHKGTKNPAHSLICIHTKLNHTPTHSPSIVLCAITNKHRHKDTHNTHKDTHTHNTQCQRWSPQLKSNLPPGLTELDGSVGVRATSTRTSKTHQAVTFRATSVQNVQLFPPKTGYSQSGACSIKLFRCRWASL